MSSASDPDGESSKCEVRSRNIKKHNNKNNNTIDMAWTVLVIDISVATQIS